MPTYVKGSKKSGGIEAALAILMSLPYNTERSYRLIQRVVNPLQRKYVVFVDRLDGYAVPLYLLSNHELRRRSLFEIVRGASHINYYTEFVGVAESLKFLWNYVREICKVDQTLEFDVFRGSVKARIIEGSGQNESGQDNSSNGATGCRRLDWVKKEIRIWVWNPGAVAMPYRAAQPVVMPYESIIKYIYTREWELLNNKGLLEDLGLWEFVDPDYLGKAALAYREYCIEGRECEAEQRVCVDEKWCRSRNVEYDVVWEGDIYKFILRQAPKIFRDWSTKFGVIGGIRVVVDGPLKGGSPLKTIQYILEPSPIIKILARSLI
jgi:hypothetical protein